MSLQETYNSVKNLIAYNLTEKGVEASSDDGLTTLANKILDIEFEEGEKLKDIVVFARFVDKDDEEGLRPSSISVELYVGEALTDTAEMSASTNWKLVFYEKPVLDEVGEPINYSIQPSIPSTYVSTVDDFVITATIR